MSFGDLCKSSDVVPIQEVQRRIRYDVVWVQECIRTRFSKLDRFILDSSCYRLGSIVEKFIFRRIEPPHFGVEGVPELLNRVRVCGLSAV